MLSVAIIGVVENSIEVNDIVDGDVDLVIFNFLLKMKIIGYDGFDFIIVFGLIMCLIVDFLLSGVGSVVVGVV